MKKQLSKDGIPGYKSCPAWLRKVYMKACDNKCQRCKSEDHLNPHRITRGRDGGLYTVYPLNKKGSNVLMLCIKCHKEVHANECNHVSHSY